jgi:hypothetical protein
LTANSYVKNGGFFAHAPLRQTEPYGGAWIGLQIVLSKMADFAHVQ